MLKRYFNYIKEAAVNLILPDPPGANKILNNYKSYKNEYSGRLQESYKKIREDVTKTMVDVLKKDLLDRTVSILNERGYHKIIYVKDIIMTQSGQESFIFLVESDKMKCKYLIDNDNKSKIFFVDDYVKFFKDNYLNNVISFQGISEKGNDMKFTKHIVKIGIKNSVGNAKDSLIVVDDEGFKYSINYYLPIKLYDIRVKELDPYGEENWEN